MNQPRTYGVSAKDRGPLIDWMCSALIGEGCRIIYRSPANEAPFRITFETRDGERMGVVAYAFLANHRKIRNRPQDEHRFQIKYGNKGVGDPRLSVWHDPYGLYTTIFLGINVEQDYFVAVDPVLNDAIKLFIMLGFKQHDVDHILAKGWHAWERPKHIDERVQVLVGGTGASLLRLIRFERAAHGEDQGHRQLLAEHFDQEPAPSQRGDVTSVCDSRTLLSDTERMAREFDLTPAEVFALIERAPRLKQAVRGWVAEEHLYRHLRALPGVTDCKRLEKDGQPDVELRYRDVQLTVECKNVLRVTAANGTPRLDFQRTRAPKDNPCGRYYKPTEFDVVAACLHAVSESWEFRFARPQILSPHKTCLGRLAPTVRVDDAWIADAEAVFQAAAG